jgi:hypothetical protein
VARLDMRRLHKASYSVIDEVTKLDTTKGPGWVPIVDDVREAVSAANAAGELNDASPDMRDAAFHAIAVTLVPERGPERVSEFSQIAAAWKVDVSQFESVAHAFHPEDKSTRNLADLGNLKDQSAHVMCGRALYLVYYAAARNLVAWIDTDGPEPLPPRG